MNRPRVFFPIETPRFDFAPAESFGEPIFLVKTKNFSPFQPDLIFRIYRSELEKHGFNVEHDFIGMTGPTNFVGLLNLFMGIEFRSARILMFDARVNQYIQKDIPWRARG